MPHLEPQDRLPRLMAIMGSGETTPTMARVHRALLARLDAHAGAAVILDTPYGFQENADDITARALDYFRESVGTSFEVASFRDAEVDLLARQTALARIHEARYVFSGPGSPSYALRQWQGSEIPGLLAGKLASGGSVVVASAAAVTVGRLSVPVYEIYKVGETPHWLPGLDLLGPLGLPVAVIPHFDNAEGGNHDTRYCYLGARRLARLEAELPDDVFLLGVDGHTALVLDLGAGQASVHGLGGVTVRARGQSVVFPTGSQLTIEALRAAAEGPPRAARPRPANTAPRAAADDATPPGAPADAPLARPAPAPFHEAVAAHRRDFRHGLNGGDASQAVRAALALERTILVWSRDTEESGELDEARAELRAMVVRLGELAVLGTRDPAEVVTPFVESLLELRRRAREARDWAAADAIRERLVTAGVELHDGPEGTRWEFHPDRVGIL